VRVADGVLASFRESGVRRRLAAIAFQLSDALGEREIDAAQILGDQQNGVGSALRRICLAWVEKGNPGHRRPVPLTHGRFDPRLRNRRRQPLLKGFRGTL
jgi:hypothetical protein